MQNFSYGDFNEIFSYPKAHSDVIKTSYFVKDIDDDDNARLYLVTCSEDNSIKLWDIDNSMLLRQITKAHVDCLSSSNVFLPDSRQGTLQKVIVATAGGIEDCSIKVWDLWRQKLKLKIRYAHRDIIKKLEFVKSFNQNEQQPSSLLVSLSYDAKIKVWDIKKGTQLTSVRLDIIGETLFLFKSINFKHKKQTWIAGVLDFQSPRIQIYDILGRKKCEEITGFYSCPSYDRDIAIKWWTIRNITYFGMAHRYGCVIWNYEGNYKVYEVNNLKALLPGRILALDKLVENKAYVLFTSDKTLYTIEFKVLGHLLVFEAMKGVQGKNIVTDLEKYIDTESLDTKLYLFKSLNTLSYNWLNVSYQNVE